MTKFSHGVCVLEESVDSKSVFICETIERAVSNNYAVILASESNSDNVIELLERKAIAAKKYIELGLLTILDRNFAYSMAETNFDPKRVTNRWSSLISKAKRKSGCQGLVAIGSPRVFFETNNLDKLFGYELQVKKRMSTTPLEAICCYYSADFSRLSLRNMIQILDCHEFIAYQGGARVQWHPYMILELITRAIDDTLGPGSSNLILKTLELVYHFDTNKILLQPEEFEDKLRKILGIAAEAIMDQLRTEIVNELSYLHGPAKELES